MAIAFRNSTVQASAATSSTTITVSVPSGVVNGDVLVMQVATKATSTITTPAGWTLLGTLASNATNTDQQGLFWRLASSEPASYSVSYTASSATASMIAISGADSTLPASAQYGQTVTTGTTAAISAPALGSWTSVNGIGVFMGMIGASGKTLTPPTGYTQPTNHVISGPGTGTTAVELDLSYKAYSAVTTIGSQSGTWSATGAGTIGGQVFIKELVIVAPTVTTTAVSDAGPTGVTVGGNVTSDGGATVTERGIVWATTANPTTSNNKVIDGGTGTGAYTDNITGLATSNTYHYRAYAINSVGTSYGADVQFTTSGLSLNNYQFIKVGDGMSVSEKIR